MLPGNAHPPFLIVLDLKTRQNSFVLWNVYISVTIVFHIGKVYIENCSLLFYAAFSAFLTILNLNEPTTVKCFPRAPWTDCAQTCWSKYESAGLNFSDLTGGTVWLSRPVCCNSLVLCSLTLPGAAAPSGVQYYLGNLSLQCFLTGSWLFKADITVGIVEPNFERFCIKGLCVSLCLMITRWTGRSNVFTGMSRCWKLEQALTE